MQIIHHINSIQTIDQHNQILETGFETQLFINHSLKALDILIKNMEYNGDSQLDEHFPIHLQYWMSYAKKHDYDGISITHAFSQFDSVIDFVNKYEFYEYRNLSLSIFQDFTSIYKNGSVIARFFTPVFHQLTNIFRVFRCFAWKFSKKHPSFTFDYHNKEFTYSGFKNLKKSNIKSID